jgi:hypothetical protein
MAGSKYHGVPVDMFYQQIAALTSVGSMTARLFTEAGQAQNHCQEGNVRLALPDWRRKAKPCQLDSPPRTRSVEGHWALRAEDVRA